ncbi:hypothetical protein EDC96DRAFT_454034, partial [Choanephora cucurbitarum]
FLKGSLLKSVFINITNVKDIELFFSDLTALCSPTDQLWGLAKTPRVEDSRSFNECFLAGPLASEVTTNGLRLPSIQAPFSAFDSLSTDVKISKILISGLPRQYGRSDDDAAEWKSDMMSNLSTFGKVVDYGLV